MRKILLLLPLLLVTIQKNHAQNNFPATYELNTDTSLYDIVPNGYWQMLEDKEGKLSFEQVNQSPAADHFHYDTNRKINFQIPTYWFRFALKNSSSYPMKIGFYDTYKTTSDWYITRANGRLIHKVSGLGTPWSKNESLKFMSFFSWSVNFMPLTIEPGEVVVIYNRAYYDYFNYNYTDPRQFIISFGSTEKAILQNYVVNESHYFNSVHDSFFFGVMLLAAIFNFFFYLIIRERTYFYFACYVFFLGFGRFNIDSEFYLVFLREHPGFYAFFSNFIWTFTDFFLAFFYGHC